MEKLRGHTTGYAVPQYVIDAPGGGGKVPINPEYVLSRNADRVVIRNFEGKVFCVLGGGRGGPPGKKVWGPLGGGGWFSTPLCFYFCFVAPRTKQAQKGGRQKIISGLEKTYPDAHCELNYSNPLELLIATILSAQCTDKRVNLVTADLFKKYRSAKDYANADPAGLEQDIKTTGFFRNKAKNIRTLLPQTRRASSRRSAAHDGGTDAPRWRGTQDGERRSRQCIRCKRRHRGGHARRTIVRATRFDERKDAGENRTGVDEARAAETMDAFQPLAHLARASSLFRPQSRLPELRNCPAVSVGW